MGDQSLVDRIDVVEVLRGLDYEELFGDSSLAALFDGEAVEGEEFDGGVGETVGARLGELLGGLLGAALARTVGTSVLRSLLDVGGDDGGE
jgi:hypothetical protein